MSSGRLPFRICRDRYKDTVVEQFVQLWLTLHPRLVPCSAVNSVRCVVLWTYSTSHGGCSTTRTTAGCLDVLLWRCMNLQLLFLVHHTVVLLLCNAMHFKHFVIASQQSIEAKRKSSARAVRRMCFVVRNVWQWLETQIVAKIAYGSEPIVQESKRIALRKT